MIPLFRKNFDDARDPRTAANALYLQPGVHVVSYNPDIDPAWTSYTPTVTSGTGTITTVSATGSYKQLGTTVFYNTITTITTNGTGATNLQITLPVTAVDAYRAQSGFRPATGTVLTAGIFLTIPTKVIAWTAAGAYPGGDGFVLVVSGTYEAA